MKPADERYFERLEAELDTAFDVATEARQRGEDPVPDVEIPIAKDMADRVENILGIDGVAERVRELEGQMSREEAALALVDDFVEGTVGDFDTRAGKIEGAVRTAVALLTEGVVAAPIEGIDGVELLENDDGTEFINVYYAGPIRSAGGTAQALSVLVADYARALLDIDEYKPRSDEIGRYAEEVALYDEDTGLQYAPKESESMFIAEHMPIMLDGEGTIDQEVSGYRDLDRVDTNAARGGMCLVFGEGIALKAPKIQRYTGNLDEVSWPWLQDLIDGTYDAKGQSTAEDAANGEEEDSDTGEADTSAKETETAAVEATDDGAAENAETVSDDDGDSPPRAESSKKYLEDLIAGRPVFSHPSEPGGFRLRYGRARNHGHATAGVHPATMHLVDDFLATGTQIKTERPGKAAGVVPVDTIEGPTVRLANGDVRTIDDAEEALEVRNGVERILDLGEYLVNVGEFIENNYPLAPASYVEEWWRQDFAEAGGPVQALDDSTDVDLRNPTVQEALEWATEYDAPLHPAYTYLWHDVSVEAVLDLTEAIDEGARLATDGAAERVSAADAGEENLVLPRTESVRETLENLTVEHTQRENELVIREWEPLVRSLGFDRSLDRSWDAGDLSEQVMTYDGGENAIRVVNDLAPFEVRERAPTRIGNRMGRPEKSEARELSPAVHTLFPIGEAGGDQRSVEDAAAQGNSVDGNEGLIDVEVGRRACESCGTKTYRARCPACGDVASALYVCRDCDREIEPPESGEVVCPNCEIEASPTQYADIELKGELQRAKDAVGERAIAYDILKGVKGLTSKEKIPEPLEKGILRAKHDVSAFKDGTVRYDMTDLPVTAVRPGELDVTVEQFRELGYHEDVRGEPLEHEDQLVELKVQDVVLSDGAAEHMLRTADFVDDLLTQYYGLDPYYEFSDRDDLVGELVFGMAPHTSAAVVGRIIGFTTAAVGYAHPYFHASKRRNCFHPETKIWYEDESGVRQYDQIDTVVESYLENPETDDFGTEFTELDADIQVPSLTEDGNRTMQSVSVVSKHPAPDHLLNIETRSGREITVTSDHNVVRHGSGFEKVAASTIEEGDMLPIPGEHAGESVGSQSDAVPENGASRDSPIFGDGGDVWLDEVVSVEVIESDVEYTYSLTVEETNTLVANDLITGQCDGDEDCVMLLLDGLLNFSKKYLPDQRGGRMDAPLVMSSRIDPTEIDDEAHNVDIVESYPREFYEATRRMADTDEIEDTIRIAEDTVGTDEEYRGFDHTHSTADIALGPDLSAYKTLDSMQDKMDAQLALSRKLRAVEESDVAERIIEYHFLPDLLGNLKAFSSQEFRCMGCNEKYRRAPLSGECRNCGGDVNLTVHEGSVNKYMDTALRVAEEFGAREYTKQRLEILETRIDRIFEDDTNKQSGIADFM